MSQQSTYLKPADSIRINNILSGQAQSAMLEEIRSGLQARPKAIASKFFYDAYGSKLFEQITRLPEYYPTRMEKKLIQQAAVRLQQKGGIDEIVEIGSGDPGKIELIIEQLDYSQLIYRPIDFSQAAMVESASWLVKRFPGLQIEGLVADFTRQLHRLPPGRKRLICFFGSTIGNFNRNQAQQLLDQISAVMQPGDRLLLGLDRVKDRQVLESAYNDSQGLTARFNRNSLKVLNQTAQTNFDPAAFEHVAFYHERARRIEMHLQAKNDMAINSPYWPTTITIAQGERIHTENSHKFTEADIEHLSASSGLVIDHILTDPKQWFSLVHSILPGKYDDAVN